MPPDYGIWSVLPPVLAITLAIATRQVFVSLFAGIWVGYLIIAGGNPLTGTIASLDACVRVFEDAGNTRVIVYSVMVGSLIALVQRSGGVDGFVSTVRATRVVRGRRSAGVLAMLVGTMIFLESSISALVTGAIARPIFDKLRMSREKLAYVCDTSSAPICILIPINGWGAFVLAQLALLKVDDPVPLLVRTIPLNFYAILSLLILLLVLATGKDFGPMKAAERRARDEGKLLRDGARPMIAEDVIAMPPEAGTPRRVVNMILPIAVMVGMVPLGLAYTGYQGLDPEKKATLWNVLGACSGSTAVFWAVSAAVIFAGLIYRFQGIMKLREFVDVSLQGAAALVPLGILIVLALAIGALCREGLGTGEYVASLVSEKLPPFTVAALVFVVACAISFSTGTSWGTFGIMLPIALPIAAKIGVRPDLVVAAVLGGGVFGDHCSPISDTTIVSSMASASDHVDHVRTQLPYALAAGLGAVVLYALAGFVL